ncbi:MAG: type II toxin-antitoxin system PemK/MazF family toxin [Bacilli bacterium]
MYQNKKPKKYRRLRQPESNEDFLDDPNLTAHQRVMENMHEQLDWTRRQLSYISFSLEYKLAYDLKRGEVYEFDWGLNVHTELSKRHYGVVLVDSYANNDIVIVAPLKSKHNEANPMSDVNIGFLPHLDSDRETLAVINQIRGLDKLRIYQKGMIKDGCLNKERGPVTILSAAQMRKIIDAIHQLFIQGKTLIQ